MYLSIGNFCGSWFGDCSIGLAWGSENGIWPVKPFAGAESCLRAQNLAVNLQASNFGSLRARPVGLDFYRLLEGIAASMQGTKATDI